MGRGLLFTSIMARDHATKGRPIIAPQAAQEEELERGTPGGRQEFELRDLAWFGKADVYRRNGAKRSVAGRATSKGTSTDKNEVQEEELEREKKAEGWQRV